MDEVYQKLNNLHSELKNKLATVGEQEKSLSSQKASLDSQQDKIKEQEKDIKAREAKIKSVEDVLALQSKIHEDSLALSKAKEDFVKEKEVFETWFNKAKSEVMADAQDMATMRDVFKKKDQALAEKEAKLVEDKKNMKEKVLQELLKKAK